MLEPSFDRLRIHTKNPWMFQNSNYHPMLLSTRFLLLGLVLGFSLESSAFTNTRFPLYSLVGCLSLSITYNHLPNTSLAVPGHSRAGHTDFGMGGNKGLMGGDWRVKEYWVQN